MTPPHSPHIAVIGDRVALGWVLESQRIAFPEPRYRGQLRDFVQGDVLYLYTTRGCFKNPTRDRGRIIGMAKVTDATKKSEKPLGFENRPMPYETPLNIESLAPVGEGVDLGNLASQLDCFPKRDYWFAYLRRSVVPLSLSDAALITDELQQIAGSRDENLAGYQARARMGQTTQVSK